jgi:hypothetical protein
METRAAHGDGLEDIVTTEEYLEERVPVEPGGTLYIDLDRGSVVVTSHDANEVRVEASARGWSAGLVLFSLERTDNDVQLDGTVDHWMPSLFGRPRILVRAWVPRDYSVEIESAGGRVHVSDVRGRISANTRGGRIELSQIKGPALLRTSGGRIHVEEQHGDLRARTTGARIEIDGIDGDVELRTSGGRISVVDATGEVDARTSGGMISVSFVHEPWGRLETTGGSIEVEFPDDVGVDLDARTSGGSIKIEHDHERRDRHGKSRFQGPVAGGGSPLKLRTSGGSIKLKRR